MGTLIGLVLLAVVVLFVLPFALLISHGNTLRRVQATLDKLAARIALLERAGPHGTDASSARPAAPTPATTIVPPPAPVVMTPELAAVLQAAGKRGRAAPPPDAGTTPPSPSPSTVQPQKMTPAIDWEAFFGVKLFAWLGGFVLFLGVVFLVKYSFENNLITPAMRVLIGAVIGFALIGAG